MKETLHIYTRVSSAAQEDGTSLSSQKELGIEAANRLGFKHKVHNEGAQSSAHDDLINRPVLTALLKQIDDGEIGHLYVWNTDRLSRNVSTWGFIRLKLITHEVHLHTPTGEQILADPATNMMLGIMGEIAQYDNKLRAERFRLGKLNRIKAGGWMGGPPPFGYQLEDKQLVPNAEEKKWVKFIFENYAKGMSLDDLRTELLNNGVSTRRGNPVWSHGSINALLQNTHYGGYYTYTDKKTGETLRAVCPAILKATLIHKANAQRTKRSYARYGDRNSEYEKKTKTSNKKYSYILLDFLICDHCGSRFSGNYKKTQTSYYSCSQKTHRYKTKLTKNHFECSAKRNVRLDQADALVWETVVDVISSSHLFKETIKSEVMGGKSYQRSAADMKRLNTRVAKLEKDIDNATNSIVHWNTEALIGISNAKDTQKVIKSLAAARQRLEDEKGKLVEELAAEYDNRRWVDWMKQFGMKIDQLRKPTLSKDEKRQFLEGIVENIVVKVLDTQTHELTIRFMFPYVGDKLIWDDPSQKRGEYKIRAGRRSKKVRLNLLKKSVA